MIAKGIDRCPRPIYDLYNLNRSPIYDQFYKEEINPVRVTKLTIYKLDKLLVMRFRRCIREYTVRWRGFSRDFDS